MSRVNGVDGAAGDKTDVSTSGDGAVSLLSSSNASGAPGLLAPSVVGRN